MSKVKTALVIAAGLGSRLAEGSSVPKPLREVAGIPLLRRVILSLARGGMETVYVVVGYEKEKIISYLKSQKWPVFVKTIENEDWKKSNGISVLKAKGDIQDNFILVMSDHVFAIENLKALAGQPLDSVKARLAVDFKLDRIFDKDDATKVLVENHLIKKIGKAISDYNAIDTGMFLLSPEFFSILEKVSQEKGDASLSDGISVLASQNQIGVCDIGDGFWQDVDTPQSLKHAEKVLFNACRKSTDGFISRNFNRHISLFFTSYLIKTPIKTLYMTLVATFVGILSGYFAMKGDYQSYLLAAFFFEFASILDGVDGELARLRLTDSKVGQWLDTLSDNFTYVLFIIGTAIGVMKRPDLVDTGLLPFAALFGLVALMICMFGYLLFFTSSGSLLSLQNDFMSASRSFFKKIIKKIYFVIRRDFFATLFFVLALFNKPHWNLFLVALATNIAWVILLISAWKRLLQKIKSVNSAF